MHNAEIPSTSATITSPSRSRGRPRRAPEEAETRNALIRTGLIYLTEKGYSSTGIDEVLTHAKVTKGSFYHYFASKEAFGLALIDAYGRYFATLIDASLNDLTQPPLTRLRAFTQRAEAGMARHAFRRGCLIGNLGQEMSALPESFRAALHDVLEDWQRRTALCLRAAKSRHEISPHHDCDAIAAFFWTGWEGAVLRAKLDRSAEPLRLFANLFFNLIQNGKAKE